MEHWTEYSRLFTALIVIIDPFMVVPILLSLTPNYSTVQRNKVVRIATITVAIVLLISAFIGETLLHWMGTSLGSFRVGGGIVLFLMSLSMLKAEVGNVRATEQETNNIDNYSSVAIVPLAIPLLAGPGAISTVIIGMHRSQENYHWLGVVMVIILACLSLFLVLRSAQVIANRLGNTGLNILNRVFGLILAAIAVEVIANGLRQLFPVLSAS
ncbi:MAG: NAAT family transporter [Gammaproteobacteria bacterium]|nr:NAAT family transporter [Gammaproteobacteria bacterium]